VIEPPDNVSDIAILAPEPPKVTAQVLKLPAAVIVPSEETSENDAGNAPAAAAMARLTSV
jgi:hypothetical protein